MTSNSPQPRPLRFLLYLEWILLGIVALSEAGRLNLFQLPRYPLLNLVCLGLLALMGLKLPRSDRRVKVIYTALELGLILVMSLVGGVRLMPLLYVVFVIRNCLIFENGTRTLITLLAFMLAMATQFRRLPYLMPSGATPERLGFIGLSIAVLFGLVVLFLQLLVNAVLAERHSRDQLAIANTQLREYALKVESIATLQERNRIAREIHDSLGHSLTAFNLHLEAALRLLKSDPEEAIALLQEAKQLGNQALEDVRDSISTLRSEPLQGITLADAVTTLVTDFQRSAGIKPSLTIRYKRELSSDLKIATYRIIQESLTNICKYAQATQVDIRIYTAERSLELIIQDNGKGFDSTQTTTGFGLQGMRERAIALGGSFTLTTAPHAGCQIQVIFPLTSL
jgi:signal transduction histidine kinase